MFYSIEAEMQINYESQKETNMQINWLKILKFTEFLAASFAFKIYCSIYNILYSAVIRKAYIETKIHIWINSLTILHI